MSTSQGHKHSGSVTQNHKAQLANAYNELGKELSSSKIRVVGNYTLGRVIGEGAYGKVRMGTHRITSTRVAIKQIPKAMSASLTREIHHHRQLHHPHITQMYEVIATESSIWIVTELCCGGELFDYLAEKGRLSEEEAKLIFGQLCLAVAYLHGKGIVHRDLKLENVLLDERCRVKLGDFGFTREFERGVFMETFCGTTGYASPEMLEGKKYQGPEVDVWSLGIILYCLLTGTLPFDDDHEHLMREKIIIGEFDDPEWLSTESRDLIKDILQKDPMKRLTISQILTHPWFTTRTPHHPESPPIYKFSTSLPESTLPSHAEVSEPDHLSSEGSLSASSDVIFLSPSSELGTSTPPTPDDASNDPFQIGSSGENHDYNAVFHRNPSETTLRKAVVQQADLDSFHSKMGRTGPKTVPEEDPDDTFDTARPFPRHTNSFTGSGTKPPPVNPGRTPVRTKRRSVSSILSDPSSPTDKSPSLLPHPHGQEVDFASLLTTPSPIIFSTLIERELLNTLNMLGFDNGQIVHSVLSNACDSASALWWMLQKKAERRAIEGSEQLSSASTIDARGKGSGKSSAQEGDGQGKSNRKVGTSVQTEPGGVHLSLARSAPQLALVPATPTNVARPSTPPRPVTPTRSPMLSPSSSTVAADSSSRSNHSTPSSSFKDKETVKGGRKARSGSVSIMQRATTALEAAGLVRKKSSEVVREEKEKDREREREREKSKETERRVASGEEPRSSHGSGSSKLTKSSPHKSSKEYSTPSTPPPIHPQPQVGSPWVLTGLRDSMPLQSHAVAPTPSNSPEEMIPSLSTPNLDENVSGKNAAGPHRNRANLLTAFRLWFNEDRKGKRKETVTPPAVGTPRKGYSRPFGSSGQQYHNGTVKRRMSGSSNKFPPRPGAHRGKRAPASSRRSSSVNSRRSSITSAQMVMLDSPSVHTRRRSFGTHTPNSERGDFSSQPSSIRSFSMQRHRKSPSASSTGSTHFRTASPMQKHHRRTGSGSSTRVVRQTQVTRPTHIRSSSTASSIHTPASSRPASYYEQSESEGPRTVSPFKSRSRRSSDDQRGGRHSSGNTTFVAQKRQGPFTSPVGHGTGNSLGRSSWKKSWGLEPPGWRSRTTHLPVEVLSMSPASDSPSIRDVFSGRQSLTLGDESDWVDEDDDIPAYAGGLGQMTTPSSVPSTLGHLVAEPAVTLSPAPRGHRSAKRVNRTAGVPSGGASTTVPRPKSGHSSAERASPVPMENAYDSTETRGGRRQLPTVRSGPAFRGHAIQEEDEGEEE